MDSYKLENLSPLSRIEPRLRWLLPADLYANVWVNPTPDTLMLVFNHLRTMRHVLSDYLPRPAADNPPMPGYSRHGWSEGTLMFTDLAGFTRLLEANATYGRAGAETLLGVLNSYFKEMIEVVSKSGGLLLEFTGDAMLIQFAADPLDNHTARAVRAGLRMQRAMDQFAAIETMQGRLSLGMRIGIHTGRFLAADIGTPRRMEHVLLGHTVLQTKRTEGAGRVGSVCLTEAAYQQVRDRFRFEAGATGYYLVVDDLSHEELGEYEITPSRKRQAGSLLLERSVEGMVTEIETLLGTVEKLASYLPMPILTLLAESASRRRIIPDFPDLSVLFVNLIGLPESIDYAEEGEEARAVENFSRTFALINAAVEARGGVLKNVTYHLSGSDMLIYFGVPNAHTNDPSRAAATALTIREIVNQLDTFWISGRQVQVRCQIGISRGPVFAAEIGEPRGRREFNILGDTVNIAARLMSRAGENQILMTEAAYKSIAQRFVCEPLGLFSLKGKAFSIPIFALTSQQQES
ncbi:MAG: adenylate/guanylate cyclase domain-containing protein [Chloroflexaceae bacterium]|nr:adenylate/guanylate cyclase domain-containing protein [Chloroflexaceae bacterium]